MAGEDEDEDFEEEEELGRTRTSRRRRNRGGRELRGGVAGEDEDFKKEEPGRTRTWRASGETPQSPFQAHLLRGYSADPSVGVLCNA